MNNFIISLFVLIFISFSNVATADWEIVWRDEFNEGNITDNWIYEIGCGGFGDNELQCYVANRSQNSRIEDGKLIIHAQIGWWGDGNYIRDFTSAKLISRYSMTYGIIEIRARLPKGKHLWPAFWMMPVESYYGEWPSSGEIDMMEYRGQRTQQLSGVAHFGPSWDNKGAVGTGDRNFDVDFSEDFHIFKFHWDEYALRWSVDGNQYHSEGITKNFWPGFYTEDGQPFDRPFYIILNLAVGGNFFPPDEYGEFDPAEAANWEKPTLEIDWVHVYEWK